MTKSKFITAGVYSAIAAGIFFDSVPYVKSMIPYLLAVLLFFNFMKINFNFRSFFRKELLIYPAFSLGIFPAIIFALSSGMDPAFRAGMLIITITPTAIGAPVVAALIGADRELIISQVIFSNMISPVVYPLMIFLYFSKEGIGVMPFIIFKQVFLIILIPLVVSIFFKKSELLKKVTGKFSDNITPVVFIFMVFAAVTSSSRQIKSVPLPELAYISLFVFAAALLFFSAGLIFFKKKEIMKSAALALGHKNTGLAIWIALSNFPLQSILPLIIYIVFHHFFNGILIYLSENSFLNSDENI